jgi:hypothetical protein
MCTIATCQYLPFVLVFRSPPPDLEPPRTIPVVKARPFSQGACLMDRHPNKQYSILRTGRQMLPPARTLGFAANSFGHGLQAFNNQVASMGGAPWKSRPSS